MHMESGRISGILAGCRVGGTYGDQSETRDGLIFIAKERKKGK